MARLRVGVSMTGFWIVVAAVAFGATVGLHAMRKVHEVERDVKRMAFRAQGLAVGLAIGFAIGVMR